MPRPRLEVAMEPKTAQCTHCSGTMGWMFVEFTKTKMGYGPLFLCRDDCQNISEEAAQCLLGRS